MQVCLIWVSEGGRRAEGVQCTEIAHPANIWEGGEEGGESTGWLAGVRDNQDSLSSESRDVVQRVTV